MQLSRNKTGLFHHYLKTKQLTGHMPASILRLMQERAAERLLEMIDRAQYGSANAATQASALQAESSLKELALLGVKQAMDFYRAIRHDLKSFSAEMNAQLNSSLEDVAEKTEDPELLFYLYKDKQFDQAIEGLSRIIKKAGKFVTEAALKCALLMKSQCKFYEKLNSQQREQFVYWISLLLENVYKLGLADQFYLKDLFFWQDSRGATTLDEFDKKLEEEFEMQARKGSLIASFFLVCNEESKWKGGDNDRSIRLCAALHTANCSDISPNRAAAVARRLAQLRNGDISLLKEAAGLGCRKSARELGVAALMQDGQEAEALNYFHSALSEEESDVRASICYAILGSKKLHVAAIRHYYFKLCTDFFADYKKTMKVRNSITNNFVEKGLAELQTRYPRNAALENLQKKWQAFRSQSYDYKNGYRQIDNKLDFNDAMNEIVRVAELAESALNLEKQESKKRKIC